jgi:hypothetical protein
VLPVQASFEISLLLNAASDVSRFCVLFRSNPTGEGRNGSAAIEQASYRPITLRTLHRRGNFMFRYICAKARAKAVAKLLPIVEQAFEHPWVADVELQIRFWPGHERVWFWRRDPHRPMHWDAPITISVFRVPDRGSGNPTPLGGVGLRH